MMPARTARLSTTDCFVSLPFSRIICPSIGISRTHFCIYRINFTFCYESRKPSTIHGSASATHLIPRIVLQRLCRSRFCRPPITPRRWDSTSLGHAVEGLMRGTATRRKSSERLLETRWSSVHEGLMQVSRRRCTLSCFLCSQLVSYARPCLFLPTALAPCERHRNAGHCLSRTYLYGHPSFIPPDNSGNPFADALPARILIAFIFILFILFASYAPDMSISTTLTTLPYTHLPFEPVLSPATCSRLTTISYFVSALLVSLWRCPYIRPYGVPQRELRGDRLTSRRLSNWCG